MGVLAGRDLVVRAARSGPLASIGRARFDRSRLRIHFEPLEPVVDKLSGTLWADPASFEPVRLVGRMAKPPLGVDYVQFQVDYGPAENGHVQIRRWVTDGATVEKAFSRMTEGAPRKQFEQACADALVELSSMRLGSDPDVDRATIVVHVDEETLSTGEGVGRLENGIPLHADTVRRLGCDGRVQLLVERTDG